MNLIFGTFLFFISQTVFALEYNNPKLLMNSSLSNGYNAPSSSLFTNSTPSINNKRHVAIAMQLIDGRPYSGVWARIQDKSFLPYVNEKGLKISNFNLTDKDEFHITVNDDFFLDDLLYIKVNSDLSIKKESLLQGVVGENIENLSSVFTSSNGIMFKGIGQDKAVYYYSKNNGMNTLIKENENQVSYLFNPSFSLNEITAAKIRIGHIGDYRESRPDKIINIENQKLSVIAQDKDANPMSRWKSFRNGVSVNNRGEVCFVAIDKNGLAHVVLSDGKNQKSILSEGSELKEIQYFTPVLNNKGMVAIRGISKNNLAGIYVYDGNQTKLILEQGDVLKTPIGEIKIFYGPHIPFGGNIAMNDAGDLVINSGISDVNGQKDLGRALISIYTK